MLKIKKVSLYETASIYKLRRKLKFDSDYVSSLDFYDGYDGCLFFPIILGNVFSIMDNKAFKGALILDASDNKLHYLPAGNGVSLLQLLNLIKESFDYIGLKIGFKYKNIDINSVESKLSVEILDHLMYMKCERSMMNNKTAIVNNDMLLVRNLEVNKEEKLRIELQNNIFSNIKNRVPLTLDDILYEEASPKFRKDYCFVLEEYRIPAGYGQIMKINGGFFLVNFGIVQKYRNRGYGYYFLEQIMKKCFFDGIQVLHLSVDKRNEAAINLYQKAGFVEIYNSVTLELNEMS